MMMNHQYNQYPPSYPEQVDSDYDTTQQNSSLTPTATDAMDTDAAALANGGSANGETETSPQHQLNEPPAAAAAPVETHVTGNEDMQIEKNPSAEIGLEEDGGSDQNTIETSSTAKEENHMEE